MVFREVGFQDGWASGWLLLELDGLLAADLGETLENRQFGDPPPETLWESRASLAVARVFQSFHR
jgi:hypothetical protein